MLLYKSWLETRSRLLLTLVSAVFPIPLFMLTAHTVASPPHPTLAVLRGAMGFTGFFWTFIPALLLAGSGIKTQTFRAQRGLHGSMFYTLSLPVSRLRLFLTRAGLGFVELATVLIVAPFSVIVIFPPLRAYVTNLDLLKYWVTLSVCGVAFYSISVLLSTFLDDLTQNWSSMFGLVCLRAVFMGVHVPPSLNIFQAVGEGSPLFTHSLPWATMGVAVACAAIFGSAAFFVLNTREY